jgi:hypothetical protein
MQLVEPAHDRQITRRYRPGPVIDTAPAELQEIGMPGQRKPMPTLDHRFALSMPALLRARPNRSSSASSPSLACSPFKSTTGADPVPPTGAEHPGRLLEKLGPSNSCLVRMNVKSVFDSSGRRTLRKLLILLKRDRKLA